MSSTNRLLGPCATFSGGRETIRVDVGAVVRRLLLFDTYILASSRLREIPRLLDAFGPEGFITLLQSGALKIQCQVLTIGVGGGATIGGRPINLPPGSVSLAMIKPHSEYLHGALQDVQQVVNLPLKQTIRIKKAIVDSLENSPEEAGAESFATTLVDVANPGLLKTAVAHAARKWGHIQITPHALEVGVEAVGEASFEIESNLTKLADLDGQQAHRILVSAVIGIGGVNSRIAAMKAHRCLTGVMDEDAAFFGEKLAFLWKEVAPQEQEARFDRVLELVGLPDVSTNVETHRVDADRLLKAREARECAEFRDWLHHLDDLPDREVVERVRGIKAVMDGLVQSSGGKAMRVLLGAGIGAIPVLGPALGLAASALDMFVVDKLFARKGPAVFINDYYGKLFGAQLLDGKA